MRCKAGLATNAPRRSPRCLSSPCATTHATLVPLQGKGMTRPVPHFFALSSCAGPQALLRPARPDLAPQSRPAEGAAVGTTPTTSANTPLRAPVAVCCSPIASAALRAARHGPLPCGSWRARPIPAAGARMHRGAPDSPPTHTSLAASGYSETLRSCGFRFERGRCSEGERQGGCARQAESRGTCGGARGQSAADNKLCSAADVQKRGRL